MVGLLAQVLTASHGAFDPEGAGSSTASAAAAAATHSMEALGLAMSPPLATGAASAAAPAAAATADGAATSVVVPTDPRPPQPDSTSPVGRQTARGAPLRGRGTSSSSSGTAGLVWLSNAAATAGPQPGAPVRKEARDEKLGMLAYG